MSGEKSFEEVFAEMGGDRCAPFLAAYYDVLAAALKQRNLEVADSLIKVGPEGFAEAVAAMPPNLRRVLDAHLVARSEGLMVIAEYLERHGTDERGVWLAGLVLDADHWARRDLEDATRELMASRLREDLDRWDGRS